MTTPARYLSLFFLIVLAIAASGQTQTLNVTVSETTVTVTGVTPGEDVVLFSCSKRMFNGAIHVEPKGRIISDTDKDGVATLSESVPLRSVWIAIDQKSGAVGVGTPPELTPYVRPIADSLFRKDAEDQIAEFEKEIPRLILLLVRPGQGAWMIRGRDGDPSDRDNDVNGRLRLAFEDAKPVVDGKDKAPKHLKAGDVVACIDPGRLDIFLGQVTK